MLSIITRYAKKGVDIRYFLRFNYLMKNYGHIDTVEDKGFPAAVAALQYFDPSTCQDCWRGVSTCLQHAKQAFHWLLGIV